MTSGGSLRRSPSSDDCTKGSRWRRRELNNVSKLTTFEDKVQPTITEQAGGSSLVETNKTQVLYDPHCGSLGNALDVLCEFTLDLETNLDNFKGVCEHNLACTSSTTSENFGRQFYSAGLLVRPFAADQVVHCELDRLFWSHTDKLGKDT